MDMLGKVAAALQAADDAWTRQAGDARDGVDAEPAETLYMAQARAAIEAMREPTDDVATAMNNHAYNGMVDWRDLHEAMIDAALKR